MGTPELMEGAVQFVNVFVTGSGVEPVDILCRNCLNKAVFLPISQYVVTSVRCTGFYSLDAHGIKFVE